MKTILTIFAVTISLSVAGQDIKKVAITNESPPFKETFYVLKSDKKTKHGEYTKTYGDRLIKGRFDHNRRVGVWEYLDENHNPELRIDFDNNKVLLNELFNFISKCLVMDGDTVKEIHLDEEPIFFGGRGNILYYILGLRYPLEARRNGIQGTVVISATITKNGQIVDEKIEEGPSPVLNDEALRAVRSMSDEWFPGKLHGNEVDVRILIPVRFKLN